MQFIFLDEFFPQKVQLHLRRFLALKAYFGDRDGTLLSPSGLVDTAWHRFILHTFQYAEFCELILPSDWIGRRLIDHDPRREHDADRVKRYLRTQDLFVEHFKEEIVDDSNFLVNNSKLVTEAIKALSSEVIASSNVILISIRELSGSVIVFKVKNTMKIGQFKEHLAKNKNTYIKSFKLVLDGTLLVDDDATFADYDILDGDVIQLLPNQSGC
eukprot:gene13572-18213_t